MRSILPVLIATVALPAHAGPLSDAFNEGAALGRSGNTAARSQINGSTAPSMAPHYTANPPETTYFGSPGLGTPASARATGCTGNPGTAGGFSDPACNAVEFLQTNPARRPSYTIAPNDPLLTRSRTITADPQAIAGNLAGTYSDCVARTVTQPDVFDTQTCHEYRTVAPLTCDKSLVVQVSERHSCPPGTWFGNFWVNTWGNGEVGRRYAGIVVNAYCQAGATQHLTFHAICTESPCGGSAAIEVDATTGAVAPQTFANFIGRSWYATDLFNRVDYLGGGCTEDQCRFAFCTRYEAEETACWESDCTTRTINEPRACGTFTFERPRSIVTVTDVWDNQCAALEARSQ